MASSSSEDSKSTIMQQLSQTQHHMDQSRYRIDVLERQLKFKEMSPEERTKLEQELEDIKKILLENEDALKALHAENRKTVSVAGVLCILCFFALCLYYVFTNQL